MARSMPAEVWARSTSAGSIVSVPGRQRDVLEAVGRADRVDLRVEDAALGRGGMSGFVGAALRSITWPSCAA